MFPLRRQLSEPSPYPPHGYAIGPDSEEEPDEVGSEDDEAELTFMHTASSAGKIHLIRDSVALCNIELKNPILGVGADEFMHATRSRVVCPSCYEGAPEALQNLALCYCS